MNSPYHERSAQIRTLAKKNYEMDIKLLVLKVMNQAVRFIIKVDHTSDSILFFSEVTSYGGMPLKLLQS